MDPTHWLTHLFLPRKERALWVRHYFDHGCAPDHLVARTRPILDATRRKVEEWARLAAPHRIRWITPLDREYPRVSLGRLHDPPGVLFLRGDVSRLHDQVLIGVVGARRGTPRGRRVALRMGASLARSEVTVVSGLALGIDAAAHQGCVDVGGRGIAVLAGGIDRITPPRNVGLGEALLERGLLVSEHPPGTTPRPFDFVARNRIIAGLSEALVVVEAAPRSGALTTLDFATQVGSTAMIVPGPVDCPHSQGTLAALRDGAIPVRHAQDVLDSLGLVLRAAVEAPLGLGEVPETVEQIARRTRSTIPSVLAALGEGELLGTVQRAGADRWCAAAAGLPGGRGRT